MLNLTLADIALWTRGSLRGANGDGRGAAIHGVFTDTRKPLAGALFVALKGEAFDAHDFIAQAKVGGATAALVARPLDIDLPQIVVADTLHALGDLASAIRAQRRARVVGITGSNGKTTVKTLLASILALHGKTHVNVGNLNNEIGLPLSILAMPEDAEYAVLEMGAGKPGDIAYLAAIARPEIGLVNNIAPAHLERMGSLEGIAETKGALYTSLPAHGIAVINADDAFAPMFAGLAGTRRVLRFGLAGDADVRAEIGALGAPGNLCTSVASEGRSREHGAQKPQHTFEYVRISSTGFARDAERSSLCRGSLAEFTLIAPQGCIDIALPLPGRHNVMNALAAAALAHALDVPLDTIKRGLESAVAVAGRLMRHAMPGGWILIDDSYNANPGSTAAAIATLASEPGAAWLVLGDMRELGAEAAALHARIGALAQASGIVKMYTTGELAAHAATAFGNGARHFANQTQLADALRCDVHPGVCVLVKGSRGSAMERVVAALCGGQNVNDGNHGGARHVA